MIVAVKAIYANVYCGSSIYYKLHLIMSNDIFKVLALTSSQRKTRKLTVNYMDTTSSASIRYLT